MEKILLEACLEALKTGAIVGLQDMGAAGLTCATVRDGRARGTGIDIDLRRVPVRETGMSAYEVMLSESQERMLLVAEKGREQEVIRIFEKWDLHAEPIGAVTASRRLRVSNGGVVEADVPVDALTEEAPLYDRPWRPPANPPRTRTSRGFRHLRTWAGPPRPARVPHDREQAMGLPSIRQHGAYQHPRGSGGGRRRRARQGHAKALAIATDCNGRYCWLDPSKGRAWPSPRPAATSRPRAPSRSASRTASISAIPRSPR
jgi:phosphoribosylformylglycinamidine synthase